MFILIYDSRLKNISFFNNHKLKDKLLYVVYCETFLKSKNEIQ
jgi:hypothetical protein